MGQLCIPHHPEEPEVAGKSENELLFRLVREADHVMVLVERFRLAPDVRFVPIVDDRGFDGVGVEPSQGNFFRPLTQQVEYQCAFGVEPEVALVASRFVIHQLKLLHCMYRGRFGSWLALEQFNVDERLEVGELFENRQLGGRRGDFDLLSILIQDDET